MMCFRRHSGEIPMWFLGLLAMAMAVPEVTKMPDSPPGFYGFDPLDLKVGSLGAIGGSKALLRLRHK